MFLEIKAFPKSSREEIVKKDGQIKAYIKAAPDKGKANLAIIELVAKEYGVKRSAVRIVSGLTNRKKTVEIIGR